ncbi:MAG: cobalt-precorrin-5B (C(1))-methyltransferase [Epsilonproteobacteria bacterium]|nr:cobalt-precorrin-5B (C(1))-methyltransferase [Campylobacterota bacterium]
MQKKLRSGYTTGTHATAIFIASLYEYFNSQVSEVLEVTLPKQKIAHIEVSREGEFCYSSVKGDNDDMDVTKGAKISCILSKKQPQNLKKQTPSLIHINNTKIYIYAGDGVGVVTKKGLKIEPDYPAINPTPLEMMQENAKVLFDGLDAEVFYVVFSIKDGKLIAKNTANAKVGVMGGISILGTRGIVKPVSASAYIESIKAEISVASAFDENIIVFTLGNSALDFAKSIYDETNIVEIGNFVYDASAILKNYHFKKFVFVTSIAKMTKVAQGFKNTHNRFGVIDLDEVKGWVFDAFGIKLEGEFVTLKALLESLDEKYHREFVELISKKSRVVCSKWLKELGVDIESIELVTLSKDIKY